MFNTQSYKTATLIKDRNNGGIGKKGVWAVAVDIGYSSTKTFSQNSYSLFPSFAVMKEEKPQFIGNLTEKHLVYKDCETGRYWIVGDAAQSSIQQNNTTISEESVYGRTRYDDPMFEVILRVGLALGMRKNEYGDPTGKEIYVQTGLPPKYLKSDTKELISAFAKTHHFTLKIGNGPELEYFFDIKADHVKVIPQPTGTLFSVASDNSHNLNGSFFSKNVIIFDAGFGTLDTFSINDNQITSIQTLPEYGMRQVLRRTIDEIGRQYNVEISLIGFQECLEKGRFSVISKFSSKSHPFGDILEEKSSEVCDEALEKLAQIYGLFDYNCLVITGGTGAAWEDIIREKLSGLEDLEIINGNCNDDTLPLTLANVRGYYMYLYQKLKSSEKKNA